MAPQCVEVGSRWRCVETGMEYVVTQVALMHYDGEIGWNGDEINNKPAVIYCEHDENGFAHVRLIAEFLDGRYVLVEA